MVIASSAISFRKVSGDVNNTVPVKHPGIILLSEIEKAGMNQKELSIRTEVSEKHISTIINGTKSISASLARKLEIALGSEKGYWTKLQSDYDRYLAVLEEENGITQEEIAVLKPLKDITEHFIKHSIMHNDCSDAEKVLQLRSVLRVSNLLQIPKITYNAAYRAQVKDSTNVDPYVLFAWQTLCEEQTKNIALDCSFDANKLSEKIDEIKKVMFIIDPNTMRIQLQKIFAECGIAFEIVKHFRGAPVQGFIKQTDGGKAILCVTIRGKKADRFWFSLFHEIGHLLNGDLSTRFVDFDTVKSEMESKADSFARDTLIDSAEYMTFVRSGKYHYLEEIKQFSKIIGVPHWITIGRLHSDEWLDWSYFANEAPSYSWASNE